MTLATSAELNSSLVLLLACRLFFSLSSFLSHHSSSERVIGYSLVSLGLLRKYLGLADGLFFWLDEWRANSAQKQQQSSRSATPPPPPPAALTLVWCLAPGVNHAAMSAHASQFVWYRRLFVLFSRYSYFNTLQRIDAVQQTE